MPSHLHLSELLGDMAAALADTSSQQSALQWYARHSSTPRPHHRDVMRVTRRYMKAAASGDDDVAAAVWKKADEVWEWRRHAVAALLLLCILLLLLLFFLCNPFLFTFYLDLCKLQTVERIRQQQQQQQQQQQRDIKPDL